MKKRLSHASAERAAFLNEALDAEIDFCQIDVDAAIAEVATREACCRNGPTTIYNADRSDVNGLRDLQDVPTSMKIAINIFLSRLKNSHWRQKKREKLKKRGRDLVASIGILVSSHWDHGAQIAKCGLKGHRCYQRDHCYWCAWHDKAEPALAQYAGVFEKCMEMGFYVYAVTASYDADPKDAGVRLVTRKRTETADGEDDVYRYNPYDSGGFKNATLLTADPDAKMLDAIRACLEAPFHISSLLQRRRDLVGWYGHRSLAVGFQPEWVVPHVHLVWITRRPITPADARDLLSRFDRSYGKQRRGRVLYPNLHISPLRQAKEFELYIAYMFEPIDPSRPYKDAVKRGADLNDLNRQVERFYQGGEVVLREVTSPRAGGCLRSNGEGYLGTGDTPTARREQAAREAKEKREYRERHGIPEPRRFGMPAGRREAERRIAVAAAGSEEAGAIRGVGSNAAEKMRDVMRQMAKQSSASQSTQMAITPSAEQPKTIQERAKERLAQSSAPRAAGGPHHGEVGRGHRGKPDHRGGVPAGQVARSPAGSGIGATAPTHGPARNKAQTAPRPAPEAAPPRAKSSPSP